MISMYSCDKRACRASDLELTVYYFDINYIYETIKKVN